MSIIEVKDYLKDGLVKDEKALGELAAALAKGVNDLSSDATNKEALVKLAADLKTANEQLQETKKEAAKALEMAKDFTREGPDPLKLSESHLKAIPTHYDVSEDEEFRGKMPNSQYNVLMLSKDELEALPEPVMKAAHRLRFLNDSIAMTHALMLAPGGTLAAAYMERGGIKSLRQWKEWESSSKVFAGAMDTAEAGAGAEWVPTGVGISLIEDVRPLLELVGYIPTISMPRSPYVYPVQGNHFKAYLVPENTADPISPAGGTAVGRRSLSTLNLTFTAKKLAAMTIFSTEIEEDSIVPIMPAVRADLAFAIAASQEDVWWNGQLASFDTGSVPAADDPRAAWNGIRYAASLTGAEYDFSGGLIVDGLTNMKGQMGKYGKNPSEGVWGTGYIGWAKFLTLKDNAGNPVVLTQEVAGARATFPNGTLGFVLGSPLVVGDDYPENMNAAGIIDGAVTTKTGLVYFNRKQFRRGEVRLSRIEGSRERFFEMEQVALKVTYRGDGKPVRTPSASFRIAAQGINLTVA